MATARTILDSWFAALKKPKGTHFAAMFRSFYHKDEDMIPLDKVEGLDDALQDVRNNASEESTTIIAKGVAADLGIADGEEFTGTANDKLQKLLSRAIMPTGYFAPQVASIIEVGTEYHEDGYANVTYNDAGVLTSAQCLRNDVEIESQVLNNMVFINDIATIGVETILYRFLINYAASEALPAGVLEVERTMYGKYRLFALAEPSTPASVDSDYIRTNNAIGTKYKGTGSYVLDVSGSKYVAIVCPPGVTLDTANTKNPDTNEKVFDSITPTQITVNCAGAATATYNIYVLETASAWADGSTFNVTLN